MCDLDGPESAEPLLREFLQHRPKHAAANLTLGQALLARSDPEGTQFLDRVVETDDLGLLPHACDALAEFYQSTGQTSELEDVYRRLSRFQSANDPNCRETENVSAKDEFTGHELHGDQLADLQRVLTAGSELASAWLARKVLVTTQQSFLRACREDPRGSLIGGFSCPSPCFSLPLPAGCHASLLSGGSRSRRSGRRHYIQGDLSLGTATPLHFPPTNHTDTACTCKRVLETFCFVTVLLRRGCCVSRRFGRSPLRSLALTCAVMAL